MQFLASCYNLKLPFLPINTLKERQLFSTLLLQHQNQSGDVNFEELAVAFSSKANGVDIFPKLPVYLRLHHTKWLRNQKVSPSESE